MENWILLYSNKNKEARRRIMKTLSKVLSLAVAMLMLASLLAGCGEKQDETTGTKDSLIFSINADIVSMDCHMARDTVTSIIHYRN